MFVAPPPPVAPVKMARRVLLLAVMAMAIMAMVTVRAMEIQEEAGSSIVPAIVTKRPGRGKSDRGGGVLRGGRPPKSLEPDWSEGKPDGSELPPWDPLGIGKKQERKEMWRQRRRQREVDRQTQLEYAKAHAQKEAARKRAERKEIHAEKRAAAKEAKKKARKAKAARETDLMELDSQLSLEEDPAFVDLDAQLHAEAQADAEQQAFDEMQFEADSAEAQADMAEMEAEADADAEDEHDSFLESGSEAEAEAEAEAETETESETETIPDSYHSFAETESESESDAAPNGKGLRPTSHVTFGREDLVDEHFDNEGGRAVFKRLARGREIVRFEKATTSSGGVAVVGGVTKMPCGKEVTDKGLFAAAISSNLRAPVEAADPQEPIPVDQAVAAVKKLPVVPQMKKKAVVDEYGDMPDDE